MDWCGYLQSSNHLDYSFRDSEASRWKADAAKRARENARNGSDGRHRKARPKSEVAADEGGHVLMQAASGKGCFCETCRIRAKDRKKLAVTRCSKAGTKAWLGDVEGVTAGKATEWQDWGSGRKDEKRHKLVRSGAIVWCTACGCFAETRANGRNGECRPPHQKTYKGQSGKRNQLNRLQANLHPVTLAPPPSSN